ICCGVTASTGTGCSNLRPRTDSTSCSIFAIAAGVPPSCCCAGGGEFGCDDGQEAGVGGGCAEDGGGANDVGVWGPSGSVTFPVHAGRRNPSEKRTAAI